MTLHALFYEFPLTKENLDGIIEDLEIAKQYNISTSEVSKRFLILIDKYGSASPTFCVHGKPGLVFKLSKNIFSQRLPHPIEGAHAVIHGGSEGQLDLEEFSRYLEASLEKNNIKYNKY